MQERLHKFIASAGYASRRQAELLIAGGFVLVNGEPAPPSGMLIDPACDVVTVKGERLAAPGESVYYALYKPEGYLSTVSDPHGGKTVMELVPASPRVYPVGRLDLDSCGLMILTNDGSLANRLTHPSFGFEKEYEVYGVWERRTPSRTQARTLVMSLAEGVLVDGRKTLPARVEVHRVEEKGVLFRIILKEGRKRQIRLMCAAIKMKVKMLKRIRIGCLELDDLFPGEYRPVSPADILGGCARNTERGETEFGAGTPGEDEEYGAC